MKILNIEPKDIHVTFDMSIKEIDLVLDALEHAEVNFSGDKEPALTEAATFLKDVFFKNLDSVSEEVKRK